MDQDEEKLLQSVALQNATSILLARQRAEQDLVRAREELEAKMAELAQSLATTKATLLERDRARAEADDARRVAQAANDAKSRFLNMMSHELRTPLGAIGGYVALLEDGIPGPLTEEQRKYMARIRHNQSHLLQLVNELLDLGKIESGRIDLKMGAVPVQLVVENAYLMIEPQISARKLRLEVEGGDPTLHFQADRERVEQIVLNLLSNAVKFTAAGGTVKIIVSGGGDEICFSVQDTGVGIPADKLDAVFDAFYQVDGSQNRTYGGTGLGLAISRHLARAMGGDLTVESVLGKGSTFTLGLPRSQATVAV
ncbi:MAG: HAMP domain-containing histidine kinase [Gemmatimonadota bacterium]|nr:HAMP domain-containing histidine kinase [Gemmatimonadota bacterium]